ncbi:hypothetical protein WALSEDRAFT_61664 [Wallemia mellicola CBS 633.66]|nr:hypothetical protein WALSEDRAFT_61664 [Wallemia mellicola CBS 633.66]EIM23828.1 hypothetical protein WALSEDRAFT_61664 [Wallemia mellicola CBS 633.66]|eukprot:XP_006955675.1 hypothetical protein WALSEDRAFT_61664 [Wallemia mellicola CBS 633.66]
MIPGAINLPADSLSLTLPSLLPSLNHGRGPRAAGWFAETLNEYLNTDEGLRDCVYALTGGIKAWKEKFGSCSLEDRGKRWDDKSWSTIEL